MEGVTIAFVDDMCFGREVSAPTFAEVLWVCCVSEWAASGPPSLHVCVFLCVRGWVGRYVHLEGKEIKAPAFF